MTSLGEAVLDLGADDVRLKRDLNRAESDTRSWVSRVSSGIAGAIGSAVSGLGAIGLAGYGVQMTTAAVRGLGEALGVGLNSQMENTKAQLMAFLKDGDLAAGVLADIRAEADKTPFAFQEMANATASLIPSARAANEPYMNLVKTAEILAASHPEQGLEGAAFAIREAVSGDFVSLVERFDMPRQYMNQLKEQGVPNLDIVRRAMLQMGYDASLVSNMAATSTGLWGTLSDTIGTLRQKISEPIFDALKSSIQNAQGWLEANKETVDDWAARINAGFQLVIEGVGWLAQGFADGLGAVFSIVQSLGQAIYEALSWLNPFATHSPSLVSQVQDGVDEIVSSYRDIGAIQSPLDYAGQAVQDFAGMSKDAVKDMVEASKDRLDSLKDALATAKDELRRWTETPLQGSKEFEDRLWAIETEIDKAQLKLANLKLSGASKETIKGVQDELDRLRLQADQVRLDERVQLEPLRKQLKDLASDKGPEKTFEEIKNGIVGAKDKINVLEPAVTRLEVVWKAQQRAMSDMTKAAGGLGSAIGGPGGMAANFKDVIKPVTDAKKAMDEWKGKVQAARDEIVNRFNTIAEPVRNALGSIRKAFESGGLPGVADLIVTWLGEQWAKIDWTLVWQKASTAATTIASAWWSWIQTEGQIAGQVVAWLGQQWSKIDWAQVWANVKMTVGNITSGFGSVYDQFTTWLSAEWEMINWGQVWANAKGLATGLWTGAQNIWTNVTEWLGMQWSQIDWSGVWKRAGNIGNGISGALKNVNWDEVGDAAGKGIVTGVKLGIFALQKTGELATMFLSVMKDILGQVNWTDLAWAVTPKLIGFGIQMIGAILDPMTWIQVFAENWQTIFGIVIGIILTPAKILKPIGNLLSRIPLAGRILEWLVWHIHDAGQKILGKIGEFFAPIGRSFASTFAKVLGLEGKGLDLGKTFSDLLKKVIGDPLGSLGETLQIRGMLLADDLARGIGGGINAVTGKAREIGSGLLNMLKTSVGDLGAWAGELVGDIIGGLGKAAGGLFKAAGDFIMDNLIKPFLQKLGLGGAGGKSVPESIGGDIVFGIIAGLTGLGAALWDAITKAIESLFPINIGPFHITKDGLTVDTPSIPNPFGGGGEGGSPPPAAGPQINPLTGAALVPQRLDLAGALAGGGTSATGNVTGLHVENLTVRDDKDIHELSYRVNRETQRYRR
jgi:hypothetical protein